MQKKEEIMEELELKEKAKRERTSLFVRGKEKKREERNEEK